MLSGLWGSASNAIASAADRLDSIGAAIKDTLAEDTTDHDFQSEAEDLEEYKKMLNDLEFKQGIAIQLTASYTTKIRQ